MTPTPARTAILIGTPATCRRLEARLDLLGPDRPVVAGWVIVLDDDAVAASADAPILGHLDELEAILARRVPGMALVCLPSVMHELVATIRTRLRRAGVPDRFVPTLEDLVAGVGPRTLPEVDLAALLDRAPRAVDAEAIARVVTGRTVAITGAGGSIGAELARIVACHAPRQLVLIDRAENALFEIDRQVARFHPDLPRRALLHDVVDRAGTLEHFRALRPDVVFHAAAHKHVPMMEDHPAAAIDNNLFGTVSAAEAAVACGAGRFVMISTDKAVNPTSVMGCTKRLAELYVQDLGRRVTGTSVSMVRFGNVLGSSGSVLETWSRQIAAGGPLTVTDPRMTRYFMTIPEAAALVIQASALAGPAPDDAPVAVAAAGASTGAVFVLDMGDPIEIVEMARRFVAAHGLAARLPDDAAAAAGPIRDACAPVGTIDLVFTGIRPGEKLHEELGCDADARAATAHPDIHLWTLPAPDPAAVKEMIDALGPARRPADPDALVAAIRSRVPEARPAPVAAA